MTAILATAEAAAEGVATVATKGLSALSWLPWALAGLSLVAGAGGTLWYRMQWVECQASVAISAAKAEEAVRKARDADAERTRALAEQAAAIKTALQEQSQAAFAAIARAKSDPSCARTPAAGAFDATVLPKVGK